MDKRKNMRISIKEIGAEMLPMAAMTDDQVDKWFPAICAEFFEKTFKRKN